MPHLPIRAVFAPLLLYSFFALAEQKKPNILVMFGDDTGPTHISAYPGSDATLPEFSSWGRGGRFRR